MKIKAAADEIVEAFEAAMSAVLQRYKGPAEQVELDLTVDGKSRKLVIVVLEVDNYDGG